MKKKEKYVKICPNCGSTNIKIPPAGLDIRMTLKDHCSDCKSWGMFPEIKESKVKEVKRKMKINRY